MVVVVVAGGAVVAVTTVVSVVAGASVVEVTVVVGAAVVVGATVVVVPSRTERGGTVVGETVVAVVDGSPIATGVSTTRSRIPATAAEAIATESAVAPTHATPILQYLLIHPSMHHPNFAWVKPRLTDNQATITGSASGHIPV